MYVNIINGAGIGISVRACGNARKKLRFVQVQASYAGLFNTGASTGVCVSVGAGVKNSLYSLISIYNKIRKYYQDLKSGAKKAKYE